MSNPTFDDLLAENSPPEITTDPNAPTAKAWQPGMEMNPDGTIHIVTRAIEVPRDADPVAHLGTPEEAVWTRIIEDWQIDPARMEIVDGTISLISWMSPMKGATSPDQVIKLLRYKVTLRRRREFDPSYVDVNDLISEIKKAKKKRGKVIDPEAAKNARRGMVVLLSDWQIGKGEGDGTPGTVKRVLKGCEQLVQHIKDLKKLGRAPEVILLVGMGDLMERCSGNYPSQAFISDLDQREQERVTRRLILHYVDEISDLGIFVMLSGVGGNHGENRNGDGKAYTRPSDNADVAIIDQVGDVIRGNPERYKGRVEVFVPDDGLQLLVEIAEIRLGFIHGHQNSSPGASVAGTLETWWRGQIMGGTEYNLIAQAQILNAGHYHHFVQTEASGRPIFQAPSQDPGSQWYKDKTGKHSPPGMLTYMVGHVYGERLWGDLFMCSSQIEKGEAISIDEIMD